MPKPDAFSLTLLPALGGVPAYRWLYSALRNEILQGRLRPGTALPSTRNLGRQYALARGTIVNAYEQLKSEGYIKGTVGSGTRVSAVLPEELLHVGPKQPTRQAKGSKARILLSDYGRRARLFSGSENQPTRAFRCNLPALDLFPVELWASTSSRCLRRISARLLMGCDPLGRLPLREALTEYLVRSRGVKCVPEQIAIVSGVQEGLDLVARVLCNPGDRIGMEDPGYTGAALVFESYGARISAVPTDDQGIRIDKLPRAGLRCVYVTPAHQFPLGTTMSLARRLELLEWAHKSGAWIFEDDYDSEFRYSGRPIPALQGLDDHERVIYAGSFSKVLFPALRLGYLVLPRNLLSSIEKVKSLTSRHAPTIDQLVLEAFMREGHFGRHLRKMRTVYAERLSVLLDEAESRLAGLLEMSKIEAGLQTVGRLCPGISAKAAVAAAARRNVDVTPVSLYTRGRVTGELLQLGFAAVDTREIRRGVRELAAALESEKRVS